MSSPSFGGLLVVAATALGAPLLVGPVPATSLGLVVPGVLLGLFAVGRSAGSSR